MFDLPERQHGHLKLSRELPTGARVVKSSGFARPARFPDQPAHGAKLERDIAQLRAIYAKRTNVLGIDPQNVAVLEFNAAPEESALRSAGLRVLDWFPDRVVVAATSDPSLVGLVQRLDKYQTGPRAAAADVHADEIALDASDRDLNQARERSAPHQALFDRIEAVRALSPEEVLTSDAMALIDRSDAEAALLFDVQCWCPEDEQDARQRHDETSRAVQAGGGRVVDSSLRHANGLSLLRVEASPATARQLALVPHVRRIDGLPRPLLSHLESVQSGADALPPVLPPLPGSPVIAVIDSGVRSGHPLIGPAFLMADATAGLDPESDGNGHGTFVASLALYGSLEPIIASHGPLQAIARLVSIRVLNDAADFPDTELWENHLLEALELSVRAGARVINLSLGDPRRPYSPDRPTPLAAVLDEFVRLNDVVLVVSTGNVPLEMHVLVSNDADYTLRLLDGPDAGMLDPATSALALTVGALGADDGQGVRRPREGVDVVPVGGENRPSPLTRVGPGAVKMVKPELSAPGGHAVLTGLGDTPRDWPTTGVLGADGINPARVFAVGSGTSYATPLVTHAAATALAANPGLSSRAIRALVLSSVKPVEAFLDPPGTATTRDRERRLVGFGRPRGPLAARSTDHRTVLLAEAEIPVDEVHLYRVPIPQSFFESGGWRQESIALAFDPQTRATRLDYLGSRMQVQVYMGATVDQVADAYLLDRQADAHGSPSTVPAPNDPGDDTVVSGPVSLAQFKQDFQPTDTLRSRGAHIFASRKRLQRPKRDDITEYVIAVQSVNRWQAAGTRQPYALAVVLERDPAHSAIYQELRATLEARLPIEIEL